MITWMSRLVIHKCHISILLVLLQLLRRVLLQWLEGLTFMKFSSALIRTASSTVGVLLFVEDSIGFSAFDNPYHLNIGG